jgi:putative ABC transport system permease protein
MIKNYFKTAFRQLWKNKNFTFINLAGLVLGLSSVMVLAVMVYQFLTFDKIHQNRNRMYYLKTVGKEGDEYTQTTYPLLYEALKTCPDIEAGTHLQRWYSPWLKNNDKEIQEQRTQFVDSGFFNVFSFPLKYGNAATALKEKYNVVLSEETAQKLFGKENPVGKTISADDTVQLTVTAVMQHVSSNNSVRPDVLLSTELLKAYPGFTETANWYNGFAENYLMLKPGANIKRLETQLNQLVKLNYEKERKEDKIRVVSFSKLPSESMGTIGNAILSGSIGTAIFILLIVIVNLINLNAGNMFNRAREVAVKQMIGSSKRSIILQFCLENAIIVFTAILLAFTFFIYLLLPQINQIFGSQFGEMELSITKDYPIFIAFIIIGLLVVIAAGAYPALHLTALKVSDTVKGKLLGGNKKSYIRNIFITIQFVLSITLVYTTIILGRQMNHMKAASLGFNKDDVAVINLDLAYRNPKSAEARFDAVLNSLRSNTAVKAVSTNAVIPTAYWENFNQYTDVINDKEIRLRHVGADAGYFATYEIPIIEGRNFRNLPDSNEANNVMINRAAMKAFGWTSAVGKQIKSKGGNGTYTVIGVTEDFNYRNLTGNIEPLLHWYSGKQSINNNYLSILIAKGKSKEVLAQLENDFKTIPSRRAFSYGFMAERVDAQYKLLDGILKMTKYVAGLTIFIACMGMFGLITLFARQRIKEIGVRKVLGATVADIVGLLSKNFLQLVFIAAIIAAPLAWIVMNGWLRGFAYRIQIAWWMLALGAVGALVIAFITVGLQAIKAAIANPVKSLRTE